MPVFSVPIVPKEMAEAQNVQPKIVQIAAGSKREAYELAVKFHPGWAAHTFNIMKARDA